MAEKGFYTIINTDFGWVGISASAKGITCVTLPQVSEEAARRELISIENAEHSSRHFQNIADRLVAYFKGKQIVFQDELDLSGATDFQRRVWEITRIIPFGEKRSYGWVAAQIGQPKASRAVGHALSKNPVPVIIPCHRVIGSDGGLCGFGGGLEMKRRLLKLERA